MDSLSLPRTLRIPFKLPFLLPYPSTLRPPAGFCPLQARPELSSHLLPSMVAPSWSVWVEAIAFTLGTKKSQGWHVLNLPAEVRKQVLSVSRKRALVICEQTQAARDTIISCWQKDGKNALMKHGGRPSLEEMIMPNLHSPENIQHLLEVLGKRRIQMHNQRYNWHLYCTEGW